MVFEKPLDTLFDVDHHPWAPAAIAGLLAVAGLLLWASDRRGKKSRHLSNITRGNALLIGCSQVLALFPGVSRSGATITAGLALGLTRQAAARFSFLMAAPITLGAGLLKVASMRHATEPHPQASALILGVALSAVVGWAVIHWLLGYLQKQTMNLFVVYRVIFAALVFVVWITRH
jgi:undecaprenyl-diphosphatase